ncbi:MAG TPA: hypothetical protein VLR50_12095, partial [Desulfobacterales bacterium]|nr:hypothetical protein [Desulfobacterales bacterium]
KFAEELDAISVSDRAAWKKLAAKVQRAAKGAAAEPPGVKELLERTVPERREGLRDEAGASKSQPLAA